MTKVQSSNNKAVEALFAGKQYKNGEVEVKLSSAGKYVYTYAGFTLAIYNQKNKIVFLYGNERAYFREERQHTKDLGKAAENSKNVVIDNRLK